MKDHNILILRTNINKRRDLKKVKLILNQQPNIVDWSIDTEDIDKVLRIETTNKINEDDVSQLLKSIGIYGEDLNNN